MNATSHPSPTRAENIGVSQFAYGKIIQGGIDRSGYARVAQSAQMPSEATIQQIRDRASIGQVHDLTTFSGATVAFVYDKYAVAAHFQRSPRQDSRGYFLQEHYLLLSQEQFLSLGANFSYLIDLLPTTIPWREEAESLRLLPIPQRNLPAEQQRIQAMWEHYPVQILHVLQMALDGQRFAISASEQDQAVLWQFLEAISALLPVTCRGELSWGFNILNLTRNQSRLKIITGNPLGSEGVVFLRWGAFPDSQPLTAGSDNTRSYLTNLKEYRQRFGWQAMIDMLAILPCTSSANWADVSYQLAVSLWQVAGASILDHQLQVENRPFSKELLQNLLAILVQPQAVMTTKQRYDFITAVSSGYLDAILPIQEITQLISQIYTIQDPALWGQLTNLFQQATSGEYKTKAEAIFTTWQNNSEFWSPKPVQQMVLAWQQACLQTLIPQPEEALTYLRQQALRSVIPTATEEQIRLLNFAIQSGTTYQPATLLRAWLTMATTPRQAVEIAPHVVPLQNLLNHHPNYSYILLGLQGYSNSQVDQQLQHSDQQQLANNAELVLLLVQKGLAWQLPGFTASQLLFALDQRAETLPNEPLISIVDQIRMRPDLLTPETHRAVALLLLSLGRLESFRQLVLANKHWIDLIIEWQSRHPTLTPTYHRVLGEANGWFENPPPHVSYDVWLAQLKRVFENRTQLTYNNPMSVNILAKLLLSDAFNGYTEEGRTSRIRNIWNDKNKNRIDITVGKISYVHHILFPQMKGTPAKETPAPEVLNSYLQKLGEAFTAWSTPRLAKYLIQALYEKGLSSEANHLKQVHLQKRGSEIVRELTHTIRQVQDEMIFDDLIDLLQEVSTLSGQELRAYMVTSQQRNQLQQQVQKLAQTTTELNRELRKFGDKL